MRTFNLFKKTILILFCACILLPFSACEISNSGTDSKETSDTALQTEEITGTKEILETASQSETATILEADSELIIALKDHLKKLHWEYSLPDNSTAIRIDKIKDGAEPILVSLSQSDHYYVCGYYDTTDENEKYDYDHRDEYVWVKYENAKDVREYYGDKPIMIAFQINRAEEVVDLLKSESSTSFEHFQIYRPTFLKGLNSGEPDDLEETLFIYLNTSEKDTVYYSTSTQLHRYFTQSCAKIDNKYYVAVYLRTEYFDGTDDSVCDLNFDLGEYYDAIMEIMTTDNYSVKNTQCVHHYGLVDIDDFVNKVLK